MTDREKAIIMAYTGVCMLTGDKFQIFHKYVEDIMGRSVWTHEMALDSIADEIRTKSKDDFIALCADESSLENQNRWIPVSERLPMPFEFVNCTCHSLIDNREDWVVETGYIPQPSDSPYSDWGNIPMLNNGDCEVVAWIHRDIPKPYKAESEVKNETDN